MIFRGCFHILLPRYCNIIIVFFKFLRTKQPLETSDGGMATKRTKQPLETSDGGMATKCP